MLQLWHELYSTRNTVQIKVKSHKKKQILRMFSLLCLGTCSIFFFSLFCRLTYKMGKPYSHPLSNYWETSDEKTCTCSTCKTAVGGLEYVADLCDGSPTKTYIFYQFSSNEVSITVSGGSSVETIKLGSPMVKMLRLPGQKHQCIACFQKTHPKEFKGVVVSMKGRAYLINSDFTLHPSTCGDM